MLLTVLLLTKSGLVTSLLAIADAWATASRMKGTAWPFGRPKALFPFCLCWAVSSEIARFAAGKTYHIITALPI